MTKDQYLKLWEKADFKTFAVVDALLDTDEGNIICESRETAETILSNGIQNLTYTPASVLIEIDHFGVYN